MSTRKTPSLRLMLRIVETAADLVLAEREQARIARYGGTEEELIEAEELARESMLSIERDLEAIEMIDPWDGPSEVSA